MNPHLFQQNMPLLLVHPEHKIKEKKDDVEELDMYMFRLILEDRNLLDNVEAWIAKPTTHRKFKIMWEYQIKVNIKDNLVKEINKELKFKKDDMKVLFNTDITTIVV